MPYMLMEHDVDPKDKIIEEIGDLSSIELFNNDILVGVYLRPEKTNSGLYLPDKHRDEDKFQSKVGLVVKKGPQAFQDSSGEWFDGVKIEEGDWIVFRPSDGWSITVNNVLCRMIDDINIKARVDHPDRVW